MSAYHGLPWETSPGELDLEPPAAPVSARRRADRRAMLASRGLWPVAIDDSRLPALLRVLAYCAGDGNLSPNGKAVSLYTSSPEDVPDLLADIRELGFKGAVYQRDRGGNIRPQSEVRVASVELHALLAALGCPVGKKAYAWPERPMSWIDSLPAWLRATYLSAFMSAEALTPTLHSGGAWISPTAVKQTGTKPNAAQFVARLLAGLGFESLVARSGAPSADGRQSWVVTVRGGEREQLRLFRDVGFVRGARKRSAAAAMLSVYWQREGEREKRAGAIAHAAALKRSGQLRVRDIVATVSTEWDVPPSLIHHGLYGRGVPRIPKHYKCSPLSSEEYAFLPVRAVERSNRRLVDLALPPGGRDIAGVHVRGAERFSPVPAPRQLDPTVAEA